MRQRRLLLLSNSVNPGGTYLAHAFGHIRDFLGERVKTVLFVPFAGVRTSFADYAANTRAPFAEMGYRLESIHEASNAQDAVRRAEAIAFGGGNTFHLLRAIYEANIIELVRSRVAEGMPYMGWSAGSNVACPTIKTTNDMPIVEPESFDAFNLVPFQINPHYTDAHPQGHAGETREQRLAEFLEVNPNVYVVGLREGSALRVEGSSIKLLGESQARILFRGRDAIERGPADSLEFLLQEES